MSEMNELKNIAGKNPFKVPENYFEEVNRKIISATAGTEPGPGKRGLTSRMKTYLAIAASIAALIIISYPLFKVTNPGKMNKLLPEITFEEFTGSYLNDIDLVILEEHAALSAEPAGLTAIDKADIIDYLLLEDTDISELFEYL